MFEDDLFNLYRINILATGFDQLFFCLSPCKPKVTIFIQTACIPCMVPIISKGVLGQFFLPPVSLKHHGAANEDFAHFPCFYVLVELINNFYINQRTRFSCTSRSFSIRTHAGQAHGFRLAIDQPELTLTKTFKSLDGLLHIDTQYMFQGGERELSFCLFIKQLEEDRWKLTDEGNLLLIDHLPCNFRIKFRNHHISSTHMHHHQGSEHPCDVKERKNIQVGVITGETHHGDILKGTENKIVVADHSTTRFSLNGCCMHDHKRIVSA